MYWTLHTVWCSFPAGGSLKRGGVNFSAQTGVLHNWLKGIPCRVVIRNITLLVQIVTPLQSCGCKSQASTEFFAKVVDANWYPLKTMGENAPAVYTLTTSRSTHTLCLIHLVSFISNGLNGKLVDIFQICTVVA